jgi:hypothetical protein
LQPALWLHVSVRLRLGPCTHISNSDQE